MQDKQSLIQDIRSGKIDINNQELFFSILIKGLMSKLDDNIKIRGIEIPHIILHTGDSTLHQFESNKNHSDDISSMEEIYNIIPRCIVDINNIDLSVDQLSSPYSMGLIQYECEDGIYSFMGEFRRYPMKLNCELKYYVDSYTDMLALFQQIITKLSFIQTYNISYMGQTIVNSYKTPDSFDGEHLMEIDGTTTDSKYKTVSCSIEIETTLPVWDHKTLVYNDCRIANHILGVYKTEEQLDENNPKRGIRIYGKNGINQNSHHEIG